MQFGGMCDWRRMACTNKRHSTTQHLGMAHQGGCTSVSVLQGRKGACMAGE